MISIKRVYEAVDSNDGARYLVERLWPRGMRKESLIMDEWLKNVAPSVELRRWFNHDPAKWKEFQQRYRKELESNKDAWEPLVQAAEHGNITLLYSAHDQQHNSAILLKDFLEKKLEKEGIRK